MTVEEKKTIPLKGVKRLGVATIGILFLSLPIFAYLDSRLGLLGTTDILPDSFGLVMAIFAVLGSVLLVSGIVGMWLMWKDVSLLSDTAPDPENISITGPTPQDSATEGSGSGAADDTRSDIGAELELELEAGSKPPFDGEQKKVGLLEADTSFVDAAASYYEEHLSKGESFGSAVLSAWRSAHGRPVYYFEVRTNEGKIRWIRVPHRGKAGGGAGAASE